MFSDGKSTCNSINLLPFFLKFSSAWTKLVLVNHCEISTEFLHVFTVIYVLYIPIRTLAANRQCHVKKKNIFKCLINAEACMLDYYKKKCLHIMKFNGGIN